MVVNGYGDDAVDVDLSYALLLNIHVKRSIHKYYYASTYRTSTLLPHGSSSSVVVVCFDLADIEISFLDYSWIF